MIKKFYIFLKSNGAYLKYRRNVHNQVGHILHVAGRDLYWFLRQREPQDYLSGVLKYDRTPQGDKYWRDLDEKWTKEIRHGKAV